MFMTVNHKMHDESIISRDGDAGDGSYQHMPSNRIKLTPQTNNFTHEAMLLSSGSLAYNKSQYRAHSNFRGGGGAPNLADIFSNTSML